MNWGNPTHQVENQPQPPGEQNLWLDDPILRNLVASSDAQWIQNEAKQFGALMGHPKTTFLASEANRFPPELHTHDKYGHRIDEVTTHPSWHELMAIAVENKLHNLPWLQSSTAGHQARAAMFYLFNQVENGVACPMSMTYAAVPSLCQEPNLYETLRQGLDSHIYDPSFVPMKQKKGILLGMAMTEKQGGSDVRSNTTFAQQQADGHFRLTGHKWFCSAPMCDGFLTLAQTDAGLTCFFVPRWEPDGTRNRMLIQRLKNKLGNRSNASSEIEYDQAYAQLVGDQGRGIAVILNMVSHTRLDCVVGSVGMMRAGIRLAFQHVSGRSAFGKRLIDQPLMQQVLSDLVIEWEASLRFAWLMAGTYDSEDAETRDYGRLLTAIGKFWVCKRTPAVVAETLECLGGAGFIEEHHLARFYREAPLNSIWEGSSNVIALDIIRTCTRLPGVLEQFMSQMQRTQGENKGFDRALESLPETYRLAVADQAYARQFACLLAQLIQAQLMLAEGSTCVGDAFMTTRFSLNETSPVFGAQRIPNTAAILRSAFSEEFD